MTAVFTIKGQTVSQKNNKQIVLKPTPRLVDNKRVREWRELAKTQLVAQKPKNWSPPKQVSIYYEFCVKDKTRRDIDNMITSCNDALMAAGVIDDDNWKQLRIAGAEARLDRDDPRAIITIITDEWDIE